MDHLRGKFLAGSALAGEQYAGLGGTHTLDQAKHLLHGNRVAQQGFNSGQGRRCGTLGKAKAHTVHYKSPGERACVIVTRHSSQFVTCAATPSQGRGLILGSEFALSAVSVCLTRACKGMNTKAELELLEPPRGPAAIQIHAWHTLCTLK